MNSLHGEIAAAVGFKALKSHLSAGFSSAAAHYSHSHLDLYAICVTVCPAGCHHYHCITKCSEIILTNPLESGSVSLMEMESAVGVHSHGI